MARVLVLGALLSGLLAFACGGGGGSVSGGIHAYDESNYAAASQEFAGVEEARLTGKTLVRFKAYRGLTRFQSGDAPGALSDLSAAKQLYEAGDRRWLPPHIVMQMAQALDKLGAGSGGAPMASASAAASSSLSPRASASAPASASAAPQYIGAPTSTAPVPQYLPPQPGH